MTYKFFTYVNISHCKLLKLKTTTYMSLLKVTLTEVQFRGNNIDIRKTYLDRYFKARLKLTSYDTFYQDNLTFNL